MGVPQARWMVLLGEDPNLKWVYKGKSYLEIRMMIWGYPHDYGKPPIRILWYSNVGQNKQHTNSIQTAVLLLQCQWHENVFISTHIHIFPEFSHGHFPNLSAGPRLPNECCLWHGRLEPDAKLSHGSTVGYMNFVISCFQFSFNHPTLRGSTIAQSLHRPPGPLSTGGFSTGFFRTLVLAAALPWADHQYRGATWATYKAEDPKHQSIQSWVVVDLSEK